MLQFLWPICLRFGLSVAEGCFAVFKEEFFSVQAWINSLWSPALLRYSKNPQKPWVFGKNPLPMGKIPKTQGFSQPCTKGIRTLCEVLIMCSSGSGTSTDVQGRKIRVNWGSVCYHTFCQKNNVWSIMALCWQIGWFASPPPPTPPPPVHYPKSDLCCRCTIWLDGVTMRP